MEINKDIEKIYFEDILIASIIKPLHSKPGLSFLTDDQNYIQVGLWNYKKNKTLPAHFHNEFSRVALKTNEAVYVVKGEITCNLYTKDGDPISSVKIKEQELIVLFNEAHEYIINEDAIVIEIKNGPYFGPDKDRVRIETK